MWFKYTASGWSQFGEHGIAGLRCEPEQQLPAKLRQPPSVQTLPFFKQNLSLITSVF